MAAQDVGADRSNVEPESTMPVQERLRPHRDNVRRAARQHPAERRQQHSIVSPESRPPALAAKDRQLVPEHEDLEFLRSVASSDEHDQLQQAADDDVEG
jgi:hypothetical protein